MVKYKSSRLDRTFGALTDPTRRAILARLEREPGLTVSALARPFAIKLPAVMKHLDVLGHAAPRPPGALCRGAGSQGTGSGGS
jgi:DNA-binding transcriptional ArsR family regulator